MKKSRLIVDVLVAIFGIVCAFVLMAEPFGRSFELGSGYLVIFGQDNWNYEPVGLLMVAYVVELLGVVLPFATLALNKKGAKVVYLSTAVLYLFSGIMMLLALNLFISANPGKASSSDYYNGLGPAFISNAVMAFIAAVISLIGVLIVKRED